MMNKKHRKRHRNYQYPEIESTNSQTNTSGEVKVFSREYLKLLLKNRINRLTLAIVVFGTLFFLLFDFIVIAWVDGSPITIFEYYQKLETKINKPVIDDVLAEAKLDDLARKQRVRLSLSELNSTIKQAEDRAGGKDKLRQTLLVNNMTEREFHRQTKRGLLIVKIFGQDLTVTESDIKDYLKKNSSTLSQPVDLNFLAENSSESAAMMEEINVKVRKQKTEAAYEAWLEDSSLEPGSGGHH